MSAHNLHANLRAQFRRREVTFRYPESAFPELHVRVPDRWPTVQLAPLYDVHLGHRQHDAALFREHVAWIASTPNVLTFNGGDLIDNSSKLSVGGGVYEQTMMPDAQITASLEELAGVRHKMLFALPGNHEQRAGMVGLDVAKWIASALQVPYYPDYCLCTIHWRKNRFRLLAHHGSGSAVTAGAQRMAARKDLTWAKPVDLYWTGHLHNPLVDVLYQTDVDQRTGTYHERNALAIISPSYLGFFGTYAAQKRYHPGTRGLAVVILNPNGRIDVSVHARGRRL
jgi:hypothetical protein